MRPIGLLLTMVIPFVHAQAQQSWVTRIPGNATCEASAVAVAPDGAVYAGGSWLGTGTSNTDMFLAKLNKETGDTLWTRFYRSANYDKVNDIALNDNGDLVAVGQSNNQYTVLHYSSDGTFRKVWRDTQHLTSGSYAIAVCVDETGAAYVAGNGNDLGSSYNIYVMKFSSLGDSVWAYIYAPPNALADMAYDIAVDASHNCYIAGVSGSNILTMKLSAAGDTAWTRRYHGPTAGSDAGYAVALDNQGNVYVAGETNVSGRLAGCVISYTPDGTLRFERTYSSLAKVGDSFSDIAIDPDGNAIATGTARVSGVLQATLVAKYSSTGDSLWSQAYRPTTADVSQGWRLAVDGTGIVYVAGQSRTGDFDITAIGYQPSGVIAMEEAYSGSGSFDDWSRDIALGDSGQIYVAGSVAVSFSYSDFTVIRYMHLPTSVGTSNDALPLQARLLPNYPNPFNPTTRLRYEIPEGASIGAEGSEVHLVVFDLLGREVAVLVDERKAPGTYELMFDASGLPSGVYLYRLRLGDFSQTRKMIVLR